MPTSLTTGPQTQTVADLLRELGDIPPERVRPPIGTARVQDVIDIAAREKRLCELVEGTLVEKVAGFRESVLAVALISVLNELVRRQNLGLVTGESGTMQIFGGLVRIPDVAYVSWDRTPDGRVPQDPAPELVPDLAVEVLSESNTPGEMRRKRREYFEAGVRLVWEIDPRTRTAAVYTDPERQETLSKDQAPDGGDVLPGFTLPLRDLFAELNRASQEK